MAAKYTAYMIMVSEFSDECLRFRPFFEIVRLWSNIHGKWGMMEKQDGRSGYVDRQHALDMLQTRLAKTTLVAPCTDRVDHDQLRREVLDRVLDEVHVRLDMVPVGEYTDQMIPVVSIAGQDEIGCRQPIQQPLRHRVLFDKAVMRDIAGMNDDVGLRL